jgi:hypothetical protein
VQYGLLTDKVNFISSSVVLDESGEPVLDPLTGEKTRQVTPAELAIDKSVIIADVTVNF